jgi:ATP-dependent helicase/nuclease subunit A
VTGTLADQAARDRIVGDLDSTLFVEAGAGSGKTKSLVDRVVALVASGTEMRRIAAITFTEKAAAELRDRIRTAFEERAGDPEHGEAYRRAIEQVDTAAIATLHAFAHRILTENPIEAELPPNVQVLDEVSSEIEFTERWRRFRDDLLDDEAVHRCLLLSFAAGIRLDDLRQFAQAFGDNWDLVVDPVRFPWTHDEPAGVDVDRFVAAAEAVVGRGEECSADDDLLLAHLQGKVVSFAQALRNAPDEYEALRLLHAEHPKLTCGNGKKDNWPDKAGVVDELKALEAARREHAREVVLGCLRRLAVELADFTLDAAHERRANGRLEFHDLLVLARELLRGKHGGVVRERLRDRYQRLLLDEFQDTDPIQIELATLIACPDEGTGDKQWWDLEVADGRLFFVGDPKQSIYRFRRADIDLFLRASRRYGDPPVALTTNFRSTPALIGWVNDVFGRLIEHVPSSQPDYQPLDPAPGRTDAPVGPPVVLLGTAEHPDKPKADELRRREADDVADAVLAAAGWEVSERAEDGTVTWRRADLGDITILLPARTSLPALEQALDRRGIPYRAETSSLVYSTREVRDLLAVARALADPTDELALVTALRSAAFGCGDDDLLDYKVVHRGGWHIHASPPEGLDANHPVVAALGYLGTLHGQLAWLAPAELLDRFARDRRLFELGYPQGHPRDLWRRLRFVIDQARAWSEVSGGTLREYLEWARMQASESARVSETILPESDADSVRIMTVHAAKGLQFPITILSGMTTRGGGFPQRVQVAFPPDGPVALKLGRDIITPEYEAFQPIDEQMDFHERLRLLYVACTRAKDHLVMSLHRHQTPAGPGRTASNAELIASACAGRLDEQPELTPAPVDRAERPAPPEPLPPLDTWQAELGALLAQGARRSTLGASDVELRPTDLDADAEAGAAKQPRDLELPPWQKGRYGTAVGRAVHGVLQTIDLDSGEGLADAAAAQAAAEGIVGREDVVARLAGLALEAPAVREAVTRQRWRETYVAAEIGGRLLEGYIDLLYRDDDGLVVVDYKTASTAADLDERVGAYRAQGGAYALAVEGATGQRVTRVVFVFLTPDGVVELDLPGLDAAKAAVHTEVCRRDGQ